MHIIRQFKAFRTSSKRIKEFGGCLLLLLLFSTTLCNNWKMLWSLLYRNGLISRFHRFTGNSLKPSIPPNRPSIFWDTVKNWVKIQVRCRFKSSGSVQAQILLAAWWKSQRKMSKRPLQGSANHPAKFNYHHHKWSRIIMVDFKHNFC